MDNHVISLEAYYQWLGNLKNLLNCISMIQKMKLKIELVEQGKMCFFSFFKFYIFRFLLLYLCLYVSMLLVVLVKHCLYDTTCNV